MGDPPSSNIPMPPPPPTIPKSNLPMLYYGLVIVGTAVIVLVLYNLIIFRCCSDVSNRRPGPRTRNTNPASNRSFHLNYIYSFKYKKDGVVKYEGNGYECAVCLSVFEEGEELWQLPKCNHSFHASCIDMWLYSHMDCPLCRSAVEPLVSRSHEVAEQLEHSRDGLLGPDALV